MTVLLAVPLLVPPLTAVPSAAAAPAADLAALTQVAARLKTAQPWAGVARVAASTAPTAVTEYHLDTDAASWRWVWGG